jgi:L-asparagine transporter-like permease
MGRLSARGVPYRAIVLSGIGLAVAAYLSVNSADNAYVILFGLSVFGALIVWIFILATHIAFRRRRTAQGLPPSPIRLWGAPVTTAITALTLLAILVSTAFIDALTSAWKAGIPFFALLLIAYWLVSRRHPAVGTPLPDSTVGPADEPVTPAGGPSAHA